MSDATESRDALIRNVERGLLLLALSGTGLGGFVWSDALKDLNATVQSMSRDLAVRNASVDRIEEDLADAKARLRAIEHSRFTNADAARVEARIEGVERQIDVFHPRRK